MTDTQMEIPDVVVITPYDSYTRHLFNAPDPAAEDAGVLCLERWKEAHGDECNCMLPWQSCPACRGEARKRYADEIPFQF